MVSRLGGQLAVAAATRVVLFCVDVYNLPGLPFGWPQGTFHDSSGGIVSGVVAPAGTEGV